MKVVTKIGKKTNRVATEAQKIAQKENWNLMRLKHLESELQWAGNEFKFDASRAILDVSIARGGIKYLQQLRKAERETKLR